VCLIGSLNICSCEEKNHVMFAKLNVFKTFFFFLNLLF